MAKPPNTSAGKLPVSVNSSQQQNDLAQLIKQGLAFHQQGQFTEARAIYGQVLVVQPNHFDALQLLGALHNQTQQFAIAVDCLNKALQINPNFAHIHSNLGNALHELKRFEEAISSYDQAIRIKPNYAEAYSNRGNTLQEFKRFEEALNSYDQAIHIKPDYAQAYSNRGNALLGLKRFEDALISCNQSIAIDPNYAQAYSNRGNILLELNRFEDALKNYDKAISIDPNYAEAFSNRSNILRKLKRFEEALTSCDKAISVNPGYAQAHFNRSNVLREMGRLQETLASCDQAISIDPNYAEAYSNRGIVLKELGRFDEALASYDHAISLLPNFAQAFSNRANALLDLKRFEEALDCYDHAISLLPNFAQAYSNRTNALLELKRFEEGLASCHKATSIDPHYAEGHWNLSILNLLMGNFKDGWQGYEWRWKNENLRSFKDKRHFEQPLWLGAESLEGKSILLYAEQGLGDAIQFCRYVPLVAQLGAKVILEVPHPLVKLLNNVEGVSQVLAKGDALPEFDYQCPLMSLPLAFKTELHSIPPAPKDLIGDRDKVLQWQAKLGKKTKPRIGLVWSSVSHFSKDHERSMTLAQLLKVLPKEGFEYICLQKEIKEIDKEALKANPQIQYFGDELLDFSDTAHLIECVDLVISTCTSVPHLSASLGKATWLLLSYGADWRWLLDREDSPWYPSAKLYRQDKPGDWDGVLEKIKADLLSAPLLFSPS